jgi:hypothetical protein
MLSVINAEYHVPKTLYSKCRYAECRYAECHYAERHGTIKLPYTGPWVSVCHIGVHYVIIPAIGKLVYDAGHPVYLPNGSAVGVNDINLWPIS